MAILGSIAMAIVYGLKVNLSVAMVAMLNHTALKTNTTDSGDETCADIVQVGNATALSKSQVIGISFENIYCASESIMKTM